MAKSKKKDQQPVPIKIELPLGGLDVSTAVGAQPPGTSPDLLNVSLRQSVDRRLMLGQRDGTSKACDRVIGSGKQIQGIQTVGLSDSYVPISTPVETLITSEVGLAETLHWRSLVDGTSSYQYNGDPTNVNTYTADGGGNLILYDFSNQAVEKISTAGATQWSYDVGTGAVVSRVWCNPELNLVAFASRVVTSDWDETNGDDANVWILDAYTGKVVWHGKYGTSSTLIKRVALDSDGNLYMIGDEDLTEWGYASDTSTGASVICIRPDLSQSHRNRSNVTYTNKWTYTGWSSTTGRAPNLRTISTGRQQLCYDLGGHVVVLDGDTGAEVIDFQVTDGDYELWPRLLDNGNVIYSRHIGSGTRDIAKLTVSTASSADIFQYAEAGAATQVLGIDIDDSDNVYVCGYPTTTYTGAGASMTLFSLDSAGSINWSISTGATYTGWVEWTNGADVYARVSNREIRTYVVTEGDLYLLDGEVPALKQSDVCAGPDLYNVRTINLAQKLYIIDAAGQDSANFYDPTTDTLTAWAAAVTDGTYPSGAFLMAAYRGRAVLSSGGQWYMSAVGDALNWDYSPTTYLETQAITGATAKYQQISDYHKCLAPYSDDMMVIGCDHEIWLVRGDPAAGGSIDNVSYTLGVAGADSWAFDNLGTFFFFGQGRAYMMSAGQPIVPISSPAMDRLFEQIDLYTYFCRMAWDRSSDSLHIFFSPNSQPATAPFHYVYHKPSGSWWKEQYPAKMGPTCVSIFDGDNPNDRAVFLGGYDGFIYKLDPTAKDDDGTQISSYVTLGVYQPIGLSNNAILTRMNANMPSGSEALTVSVYAATTPEAALAATTAIFTRDISSGRVAPMIQRVAGNSFKFKLACKETTASDDWAMSQMDVVFEPSGMARYGRI